MKKIIFLGLALVLFTACSEKQRYTQNSSEIDTVKKLLANYNGKTYDTGIYADTSKTNYNSKTNSMTPDETMAYHKENDANYTNRGFLEEDQEFEMVVTDKGQTWVNCWLDWKGTLSGNGKVVNIPIHLTYQFVDGKIVREVGHWDPTEVVLALQEMEAKNALPSDQKVMDRNFDDFIKKFHNKQDMSALDDVVASNYVRYMNGTKAATGAKELGEGMNNTFMKGFPDMKITTTERIYDDNKLYVHWNFNGTNTGEFNGAAATGKQAAVLGLSEILFNSDGKIYLEKVFFNELDLMTQLGYTVSPPK